MLAFFECANRKFVAFMLIFVGTAMIGVLIFRIFYLYSPRRVLQMTFFVFLIIGSSLIVTTSFLGNIDKVTGIFGEDVGPPLGGVFTATQGLETAWNTEHSQPHGYQTVGRQLGRAIERYLRTEPRK